MAELTQRLRAAHEEIFLAEKRMSGEGQAKLKGWRLALSDALDVLDSGSIKVVPPDDGRRTYRTIAVEVMETRSRELRWGLSPEEWVEFVATGGLYNSVMDAVLEAWEHAGYEVVKGVG